LLPQFILYSVQTSRPVLPVEFGRCASLTTALLKEIVVPGPGTAEVFGRTWFAGAGAGAGAGAVTGAGAGDGFGAGAGAGFGAGGGGAGAGGGGLGMRSGTRTTGGGAGLGGAFLSIIAAEATPGRSSVAVRPARTPRRTSERACR